MLNTMKAWIAGLLVDIPTRPGIAQRMLVLSPPELLAFRGGEPAR